MCLISQNIKPLVSDKDIIAYKQLIRIDGEYYTPYQKSLVKLNQTLKAKEEFPQISLTNNIVGKGAIHAYLTPTLNCIYRNVVIKAGTPFFVSRDFSEIAASEIYITSIADYSYREAEKTYLTIYDLLRKANSSNGVAVGDYLLSDKKTFITPENVNSDMDVIGIVSFIYPDGRPHIIGLEQQRLNWSVIDKEVGNGKNYIEVLDDLNGRFNTDYLIEKEKSNISKYPAFDYCFNYKTKGTEKGDWFLPASGEILRTACNACLINISISNLANRDKIFSDRYFSSTEMNKYSAWSCYNNIFEGMYKKLRVYVRPSLNY